MPPLHLPPRLLWLGLLPLLALGLGSAPAAPPDPCTLSGTVYVEKSPSYAQYRVYVHDSEAFADLIVCKQENKLFADQPGLWHFTDQRQLADFSIYLEKSENMADFSIAYTDTESFAGCNR